jgi:hypothetical protein
MTRTLSHLRAAPILFAGALLALSILTPSLSTGDTEPPPPPPGSSEITGWLWSDTVGWISANCSNDSSCATVSYKLEVASDGTVSGYAWSEHIGWISANASDLSGCPSSPCSATLTGGNLTGWFKALAGGTSQSGGWDGFISLSGSGYGVTVSGNAFSGYAWGSTVVGWVDFSQADLAPPPAPLCADTAGYFCSGVTRMYRNENCAESTVKVCSYACSPAACVPPPAPQAVSFGDFSGHLQVQPSLVIPGATVRVYWNLTNVTASSCSVTGTNGDSWTGLASSGADGVPSSPILEQTIYTLSCNSLPEAYPPSITETETVNIIPIFQEL